MAALLDPRTGLPVVAMVGGGQLSRMTHQAAIALGQSLRVLATDPAESAAQVAADVQLGDHRDLAALQRLADGATVLTFDHEHVPTEHLRALEAAGHRVAPGPAALVHAQDKLVLRRALAQAGEPQPAWAQAERADDVAAFAAEHGWPVVLKTPRGGYDGKGVFVVDTPDEAAELLDRHGTLLVEARVDMVRELAVRAGRGVAGRPDRAAERRVRRGVRAGAGVVGRTRHSRAGTGRPDRRPARRGRHARRGAVRDRGRRPGERAGDAPAQLR